MPEVVRRLTIARSFRLALLGLTLTLAVLAGAGVARLYDARQRYEDRLGEGYARGASARRGLAGGGRGGGRRPAAAPRGVSRRGRPSGRRGAPPPRRRPAPAPAVRSTAPPARPAG